MSFRIISSLSELISTASPCLRAFAAGAWGYWRPHRRADFTVYRSQTIWISTPSKAAGVYWADKINVIQKSIYFSVNRVILAICAFYSSTWSNIREKNPDCESLRLHLCLFLHTGVIIELGLWCWWLLWYLWFLWHVWESLWGQNLSQGPCFLTHVSLPVL